MKFITNKVNILLTVQYKDIRYETTYGLSIAYFPGYLCVNKTHAFFLLWKTGQGVQGRMGWGSLALRPLGGGVASAKHETQAQILDMLRPDSQTLA